jgi:hypothetical protein
VKHRPRLSQLAVVVAIGLGSSCIQPSSSRSSLDKAADEQKSKEPVMTHVAVDEARRIVNTLAGAGELTKEEVEQRLQVTLAHSSDVGQELLHYEAVLPTGPFGHIELRQPNAQQARTWLIVLTVRDGVQLPLKAFLNYPIPPGPPQDINPHIPPEGANTYIIKRDGQSIHYEFGAQSELLRLVALHRPPSVP